MGTLSFQALTIVDIGELVNSFDYMRERLITGEDVDEGRIYDEMIKTSSSLK